MSTSLRDGKRSGLGATTYDNGDIYTGEYEDDLRNGEGVMVMMEAGRRYSGNYVRVSAHSYVIGCVNHAVSGLEKVMGLTGFVIIHVFIASFSPGQGERNQMVNAKFTRPLNAIPMSNLDNRDSFTQPDTV